ncbi:MAG: glycosyltransferase family 39 protein [Lachnospiraceae bacterium]|nr:glycosyltransferase family 39 protein [Lachnospiraceae bacterium]
MPDKELKNSIFGKLCNNPEKVYIILTVFWISVCAIAYLFLCTSPVCGYDESYTVSMISHSFSDIVRITSMDVHSPMYYFLVRIFSFLPGIDPIHAPKLFSYLCTILFLMITSLFAGKKYGRRAAFFTVFIASVSPMMINQVCNGRMYAPGLLFFSAALYEACLLWEEISAKRVIAFMVSSVITVWLQHVFMTMTVMLFIIFIVSALVKKEYKRFRTYLFSGMITGASFIPWLLVMIRQFSNKNSSGSVMHPLSDVSWYKEYFRFWKDELFTTDFYVNGYMIRFWIVMFLLMVIGLMIYIRKNKNDLLPLLGPVLMLLTFLTTGMLLVMYSGQFYARYAFPAFSGIWLCMGVLLAYDPFEKKALNAAFGIFRVILLLIALCFGIMTFSGQKAGLSVSGIDDYLACMDEVSEGDAVMFSDTWSSLLQIYDPDEEYWIYGFNPDGMPYDYKGVYTNSEQMDAYKRVWLIGNDMIQMNSMGEGYTVKKTVEFNHHSYHFIVKLYEKS